MGDIGSYIYWTQKTSFFLKDANSLAILATTDKPEKCCDSDRLPVNFFVLFGNKFLVLCLLAALRTS